MRLAGGVLEVVLRCKPDDLPFATDADNVEVLGLQEGLDVRSEAESSNDAKGSAMSFAVKVAVKTRLTASGIREDGITKIPPTGRRRPACRRRSFLTSASRLGSTIASVLKEGENANLRPNCRVHKGVSIEFIAIPLLLRGEVAFFSREVCHG